MKFLDFRFRVYITLTALVLVTPADNPVYESPVIYKQGTLGINPKNEFINDKSQQKYERYLNNKLKNHLQGDLIGNLSIENLEKWLSLLETSKFEEMTTEAIIENVGGLLTKSIELQKYVKFTSQATKSSLNLMDLKLKQISVLEEQIDRHFKNLNGTSDSINEHINSENTQRLIDSLSSSASLFNLNYHSACEILKVGNDQLQASSEPSQKVEELKPIIKTKEILNHNKDLQKILIADYVPQRNPHQFEEALKAFESSKFDVIPVIQAKSFRFSSINDKKKKKKHNKRRKNKH